MPITWKNVNGPNQSGAASLARTGGDLINKGAASLQEAIGGVRQQTIDKENFAQKEITDNALVKTGAIGDLAGIMAARKELADSPIQGADQMKLLAGLDQREKLLLDAQRNQVDIEGKILGNASQREENKVLPTLLGQKVTQGDQQITSNNLTNAGKKESNRQAVIAGKYQEGALKAQQVEDALNNRNMAIKNFSDQIKADNLEPKLEAELNGLFARNQLTKEQYTKVMLDNQGQPERVKREAVQALLEAAKTRAQTAGINAKTLGVQANTREKNIDIETKERTQDSTVQTAIANASKAGAQARSANFNANNQQVVLDDTLANSASTRGRQAAATRQGDEKIELSRTKISADITDAAARRAIASRNAGTKAVEARNKRFERLDKQMKENDAKANQRGALKSYVDVLNNSGSSEEDIRKATAVALSVGLKGSDLKTLAGAGVPKSTGSTGEKGVFKGTDAFKRAIKTGTGDTADTLTQWNSTLAENRGVITASDGSKFSLSTAGVQGLQNRMAQAANDEKGIFFNTDLELTGSAVNYDENAAAIEQAFIEDLKNDPDKRKKYLKADKRKSKVAEGASRRVANTSGR